MHNSHNFRPLNIWLGADIEIVKSRLLLRKFIVIKVFLENLVHVVNTKRSNFFAKYNTLHVV